MSTLCLILARAGSKGLPGKNIRTLAGRPMVAWTIEYALAARRRGRVDHVALSTDGPAIAAVGREMGIEVIDRPAELAGDTSPLVDAVRHAVGRIESRLGRSFERLVLLYGNVPVRPADLIDRALARLEQTGCDSVQSVCPVGKHHPYWMKRLDGDRLLPFIDNTIDRRQDLPGLYLLDGGIIALRRACLDQVGQAGPHAFLGRDRRAVVTDPGQVVDIDEPADLAVAESALADAVGPPPVCPRQDDPAGELSIAGRPIGPGRPTFIVAELGVNHDGQVRRALELTRAAHACGADAVKLQLFSAPALLSAQARLADYQAGSADDAHDLLARLQLSVVDMLEVKALAGKLGLAFLVTPFSLSDLPAMQQLQPDAVKIASPDCVNRPLIQAMRSLGRPLLVSVGAADWQEVGTTRRWLAGHPAALLHCVSAYPVPDDQAHLCRIDLLAGWGLPVGYSDHTGHELAGALAVAAGACLVEKHLTHDRRAAGPDHAASFDPAQFARYVAHVRDADRLAGRAQWQVDALQDEVRRLSRQSLCAARDLPAGHVLQRCDLTLKRPGTGLPPHSLEQVLGRRLKRHVPADHLLQAGDLA